MNHNQFSKFCFLLLLIIAILSILIIYKLNNPSIENYRVSLSLNEIMNNLDNKISDIKYYSQDKIEELKDYLKNIFKNNFMDIIIRKLFKFLNNSEMKYLGKNQDIKTNPNFKLRKTITGIDEPTLLEMFATRVKIDKNSAKKWLLNLINDNLDDYIYEQWKLKDSFYNKLYLLIFSKVKMISFNEVLESVLNIIINNDFDFIVDKLKQYKDKRGINIYLEKSYGYNNLVGDFGDIQNK